MERTQDPITILNELVAAALDYTQQRQIAKANKSFLAIYSLCREFPFILWDSSEINKLAKTYLLMFHFETFETEEENIEISHWAYFYAYRSYMRATENNDSKLIFESLKNLVLITDECSENFIESAAKYFQPRSGDISQQIMLDSRQMAARIMPLVTYSFILDIEDRFNSFQDDELLEEVCNKIEMDYGNISEKLTKDASNIAKLLFAFTANKIQNKDFSF